MPTARTVLLARLQRKLEQHNVLLAQRVDIPHPPLFVASATPATTQMGQADLIVKHVALLASFLAQAMPRALTAPQVDIKIMAQKEVALFAPLVALMLQRGRTPRASFARLERLRPQMESCVSCQPGTYAATDGSPKCLQCPNGKTHNIVGAQGCESCPAGKHSGGVGNTECIDCEAGKHSEPGAHECLNCPSGKYQDKTGQAHCTDCVVGRYSDPGKSTCTDCGPGTYADVPGSLAA